MRRTLWSLLLLLILAIPAQAQVGSLQNPGLDEGSFGPYTGRRSGLFPIYLPAGWNVWLAAQSGEYYNRSDRMAINPHPGPAPPPVEGNRALSIDCGYVTCTVAIYQQVTVAEGVNVQASAWAYLTACNLPPNGDKCFSSPKSGAQTRVGIDPNGGDNPNDSDVVWSAWAQPHDQWLQMNVSATTSGTTATVFLYSTQANVADVNKTIWDNVSFQGGGEGSAPNATPVPTAPPEVPFVVPQNARDDGSIIHVVGSGDTIDSIAVAYGMTRQEILDLNPDITDPRLIRLGQQILIREPQPDAQGQLPGGESTEEAESSASGLNLEATVSDEEMSAGATAQAAATGTVSDSGGENATPVPQEVAQAEAPGEPSDVMATPTDAFATLTPAPVISVAEGLVVPASDPGALTANVCVTMFDDTNKNRIWEPQESLLAGGTIQLSSVDSGDVAGTVETDGFSEPYCFEDLPSGTYVAAAQAPPDYGLTSPDQLRVQAQAGTRLDVHFGAAQGIVPVTAPPADAGNVETNLVNQTAPSSQQGGLNDLLNISGLMIFGLAGLVLVGGLGLTLFMRRR